MEASTHGNLHATSHTTGFGLLVLHQVQRLEKQYPHSQQGSTTERERERENYAEKGGTPRAQLQLTEWAQ